MVLEPHMIFRKLGKEDEYSKRMIVNLRKIFPLGNIEQEQI